MASMRCYTEVGKEFDYYGYGNQKPTTYSSSGFEQSYYEKEKCHETKPEMMGYGHRHGSNPCGPMMGHGKLGHRTGHGGMGYGMGHNGTHGGMGYGTVHNMHKPGSNGLGMGLGLGSSTPLGHVMGFGKKHEVHSSYGMGSSGCTTYKKQHRRRRGYGNGSGSGSDSSNSNDDGVPPPPPPPFMQQSSSDSSDDERRC